MKFSDYKKPCQNVGGILRLWLQNSCDVSEDISEELTFVTEPNFYPSSEFAEYQFTRESARITEEEINNKNGRLVIYKLRFNLAKATIENEREINKLRISDKIIVVAQDNNKQFRVFGNKCNPAEIRITYNSGTTKGNENIYSVEIKSAEVQKPYRLPIPTDPPYVPPPRSVIPIYLNIASRTLVFKANWDYLSQRIYRMYGGLTTDSFVFKVNPDPLAVDESHPSWAALPYLNHAEFIASTINQNFQIWIECVLIDLLVTEVLIETGKASINLSNAILIEQHYQTAASDIMLALPTVGSSSSNFSSAIASNIYYGRRENADFITGEDFTDFGNTLADVNAGLNFGDVAHIHFENTVPLTVPTHFKTINVNFGSGYEVAQIETPLKKQYYPFNENPKCIEFNTVDDTCEVMELSDRKAFDFALIPNKWIVIKAIFKNTNIAAGSYRLISIGDVASSRRTFGMSVTPNGFYFYVQSRAFKALLFNYKIVENQTYNVQLYVRKKGNSGDINDTFDIAESFMCVNGDFITPVILLNSTFSLPILSNISSHKMRLGQDTDFVGGSDAFNKSKYAISNIQKIGFSILDVAETRKEAINFYLTNNITKQQYAWDFTQIENEDEVKQVGTIGTGNAKLNRIITPTEMM